MLTLATSDDFQKADFTDLVGKWVPDPAFDEIIKAQRRVDWKEWT
jgi:hypothetical protein